MGAFKYRHGSLRILLFHLVWINIRWYDNFRIRFSKIQVHLRQERQKDCHNIQHTGESNAGHRRCGLDEMYLDFSNNNLIAFSWFSDEKHKIEGIKWNDNSEFVFEEGQLNSSKVLADFRFVGTDVSDLKLKEESILSLEIKANFAVSVSPSLSSR